MAAAESLTAEPVQLEIEDASRREFLRLAVLAGLGASSAGCQSEPGGSGDDETRMVNDFYGPVTVPVSPARVVAAEPVSLSTVLALGVKPVGAAVNRLSLPHYLADQMTGVEDLTTEGGMDLEEALALDPDLIVTVAEPKESYDLYKAAVATFGFKHGYVYIEEIRHGLEQVARVLGREERVGELMDAYARRTEELGRRVRAAGLGDKAVSVVRLSEGGNYSIRVGTSESIVFRALGIAQPPGQRDPKRFRIEFSLENLEILNQADTVFVYVDDNASADRDRVVGSRLWKLLQPVRNKRIHFVNSGIWNSIDVRGLMLIMDDIEKFFIAPREA